MPVCKKRGTRQLKVVQLENEKLSSKEVDEITKEILEQSRLKKGLREINRDEELPLSNWVNIELQLLKNHSQKPKKLL